MLANPSPLVRTVLKFTTAHPLAKQKREGGAIIDVPNGFAQALNLLPVCGPLLVPLSMDAMDEESSWSESDELFRI